MKIKNGFLKAIGIFTVLSIIVAGVSIYFVFDKALIGPAFVIMGLMSLGTMRLFKVEIISTYPDIVFGIIDNGILVFAAVLGGTYAGITGAVIGGAAGNTLTDGFGGLLEGHIAERLRKKKINDKRTALSTMLGKIVGCLLGAGVGLILVWFISLI